MKKINIKTLIYKNHKKCFIFSCDKTVKIHEINMEKAFIDNQMSYEL